MSRTRRSHRRGCMGNLEHNVELGFMEEWETTRDGPSNIGPDRGFKEKYRRRDRRERKRIGPDDLRPVRKKTVEYDYW